MDGNRQATDAALDERGQLAGGRQEAAVLAGHELRARGDGFCGTLHQGDGAGHEVGVRAERHLAAGQGGPGSRQGDVRAGGGPRVGPEATLLEGRLRRGDDPTVAVDDGEVHIRALDVELGHEVAQALGLVDLALERVEQLRIRLAQGERGVHHAHDRDRVGGDLDDGGVSGAEHLGGGVLEPDLVAGHAQEVLVVVRGGAGRVDLAAVDRGVQRDGQRHAGDAGDLAGEFRHDRVERGGVSGALDGELAGELAFFLQLRDQRIDGRDRPADRRHARPGVDGRLDVGEVRVGAVELLERLAGELDDGHGTFLVGAGDDLLALAHEAGAVARDEHRVLVRDAAGGVASGDLAHGHAHRAGRLNARGGEQVGQGNLDGGDGDLGGLGVVGLLVVKDDVHERPAGLEVDELIQLLESRTEVGRHLGELLAHLAVLGAEAGVDEHGARLVGGVRGGDADRHLAVRDLAQPLGRLLDGVGDDDGARARMVAPHQGAGDLGEVGVVAALEEVGQVSGRFSTPRRQQPRHRKHGGVRLLGVDELGLARRRIGIGRLVVGRVEVGDDDVRVGAAEAESGHAGDLAAGVFGPFARVLDDLEALGVEVDVAVRVREVHGGRQHVVADRLDDLGQGGEARRGLGVADVGLRGAEQRRLSDRAALAEHLAQGGGLDRVAEDGAGAVRLDVVDVRRVDVGVGVGAVQDVDLCLRVGGGDAVGVSVGVDRRTLDDGVDLVAVGDGVVDTLEHEGAHGLGADEAVRVVGEGVDGAGRADDAELAKRRRHERGGEDVDAAGECHVGGAVAKRADGLVDGDQRRRAGGVDVERRAAEVEGVGDPVRDDRTRRAGQGVRVGLGGVGGDEHAVVAVGGTHVHADGTAAQLVGRDAGVLERMPGLLQDEALLRVDVLRLERGQAEEFIVEGGDVVEVAAVGVDQLHLLAHDRVSGVFAPPAHGARAGRGAALDQQLPVVVDVVGAGEPS